MDVELIPFAIDHAEGVAALCAAEGWMSLGEAARVIFRYTAPGAIALSALDRDGTVVGTAHLLTDGFLGYLTTVLVTPSRRGQGIGRRLIDEMFAVSGIVRMELLSEPASQGFYASRPHKTFPAFRIYPPA